MDLRHLPEGTHSLAPRPGSLARLAFHKWSAWGDLHSQGCSGLSRTGLLFPVNHTPVGAPGLAPGRLSDLKSPGSSVPTKASRRDIGLLNHHEKACEIVSVPQFGVGPEQFPIKWVTDYVFVS